MGVKNFDRVREEEIVSSERDVWALIEESAKHDQGVVEVNAGLYKLDNRMPSSDLVNSDLGSKFDFLLNCCGDVGAVKRHLHW